MRRKTSRLLWIPGLLLLGGLVIVPRALKATAQEPTADAAAQEPASPADLLYEKPDPSLIDDEPLVVKPPLGLPPLSPVSVVPASNPLTKGAYELGRQLYFDPRVSLDGSVSCATCHNPDKGWGDGFKVSTGIDSLRGNRSAPVVTNTVYGKSMFWDGREPSLETQAQGPMINPVEMGNPDHDGVVERIREIPGYQEQFKKVYGTNVTLDGMAKALATFERVAALSGNSKYDQYNTGEVDALNESEKRGMVLFGLRLHPEDEYEPEVELQKAKCTLCHVGANFTDELYHNLGIGWNEEQKKFEDVGRFGAERIGHKNEASMGAFKTPTVRDAELSGPYMHDGSLKTLEDVMDHYNKGGTPNPHLSKDIFPLNLTQQESDDVVAFMKALTGQGRKTTDELLPELPPDEDGSVPDARAALTPPGM